MTKHKHHARRSRGKAKTVSRPAPLRNDAFASRMPAEEQMIRRAETPSSMTNTLRMQLVSRLDEARENKHDLISRIRQLNEGKEEAWEEIKDGVENAWFDLKRSLDRAKVHLWPSS